MTSKKFFGSLNNYSRFFGKKVTAFCEKNSLGAKCRPRCGANRAEPQAMPPISVTEKFVKTVSARKAQGYLCILPEASPPANFSTSATVTML